MGVYSEASTNPKFILEGSRSYLTETSKGINIHKNVTDDMDNIFTIDILFKNLIGLVGRNKTHGILKNLTNSLNELKTLRSQTHIF